MALSSDRRWHRLRPWAAAALAAAGPQPLRGYVKPAGLGVCRPEPRRAAGCPHSRCGPSRASRKFARQRGISAIACSYHESVVHAVCRSRCAARAVPNPVASLHKTRAAVADALVLTAAFRGYVDASAPGGAEHTRAPIPHEGARAVARWRGVCSRFDAARVAVAARLDALFQREALQRHIFCYCVRSHFPSGQGRDALVIARAATLRFSLQTTAHATRRQQGALSSAGRR